MHTTTPSSARPRLRHPFRIALGLVAVSVAATACTASVSVGGSSIDEADLEQQVAEQLAATVGEGVVPNIDCPGDLEAEVDASTTCELTVDGDDTTYQAQVVVTAVNDGVASFSVEVVE